MTQQTTPAATPPGQHERIDDLSCRSFQGALELVGRRWTGAILLAGLRGARRFGEYRTMVGGGISDRLLAQRLKELEAEGLIERTVIPSTPVQIRYALTGEGRELMSVLQPLVAWSLRRSSDNPAHT
ncbi:HxlR family transcriptional regulator [Micromonospora pisi]|uniref:HxlR family transcriptional regulator n=1 Tax=Micromonospora pisi TaxID=589240 RepID=A0A495JFX8_9ACTN|nr:helix-turn-helix domain-containing protein [Micromonospora pisi]RKR87817.1 HxlR family transcriptional regulator [Micromonospora pisi]